MAKIDQRLLDRMKKHLGLSQPQVYKIIAAKARQAHLPRHIAALAAASERGLNIAQFAEEADLAVMREAALGAIPTAVIAPGATAVPPVSGQSSRKAVTAKPPKKRRGTSVFVVHGRNEKVRTNVFTFLRALGLQPLEWNQAVKMTKQASPYVGTILDTAFREAAAVVVVMTPDDEARLREEFRKPHDPPFETKLTGQARPNVLFEAGMAFGRNPENTVIVQLGETRPFSDVAGRHLVHLSNTPTSRQEFATKLANAGCNVNTSGTDWLTVADLYEMRT